MQIYSSLSKDVNEQIIRNRLKKGLNLFILKLLHGKEFHWFTIPYFMGACLLSIGTQKATSNQLILIYVCTQHDKVGNGINNFCTPS